ncbi:MAG: tRNA adenosine(34) deaminase TadA [Fibrobacterota bacterium]|nr:tRNA adenosine(34) deaminase TadA [Fibrobacterota bacterium]
MNMLEPPNDEYYMRQALREAQAAYEEGEVPIGCVIVKEGKILGRGRNHMETLRDPTAHAEILAMGAASSALDNWRLDGCTLYATLEPCPMCAGAILNGRVSKVVYGSKDKRLGALGSVYDILNGNPLNREIEVVGGVLGKECLDLLRAFFQDLRKRPPKTADSGE